MTTAPQEIYTTLKLYVKECETIETERIFDAVLKFIKKEDVNLSVFFQRCNASIDENLSITSDSIEVLSYDPHLLVTAVGETGDIEKMSGWLEKNCHNGIIAIEKPAVIFLNKARKLISLQKLTAEKIMTRSVVCVYENTCITDIINLIYSKKTRFLPVLRRSDEQVIGIITEGDLIKNSLLPIKTKFFGAHDLSMNEFNDLVKNLRQYGHIIAYDVMKAGGIISVAPDAKLKDVIFKMNKNKLKRVPVIDSNGKLKGVISRLDIFKSLSPGAAGAIKSDNGRNESPKNAAAEDSAGETDGRGDDKGYLSESIKKFIDYDFKAVSLKTKIESIVAKIDPSEFTFIPVTDDSGKLRGIITDDQLFSFKPKTGPNENLFKKLYNFFFSNANIVNLNFDAGLTAEEIMKPVANNYFTEETSMAEALNLMINKNLKMVAVTDNDMVYKGIVSRRNFIRKLIN